MITVVGTLKGGTGKSTVSFNLAVWLASHGFKVVAFDLDPQKTLVDVVDIRTEEGYQPPLTVETDIKKLKRKKGHQTLVDVGTADMSALKEAIKKADRVIIPVPPSQADVWSTQRFLGIVEGVMESKKSPELLAFVNKADTNPAIRETNETQEALKQLPDMKFVMARLGHRTIFRRSFSEGLAVFELQPNSKAATEMNALATVLFSSLFIQG
jgi:chromosome partitioning protein